MHLLLLRLFVSRIVVELFGSADVDLASSDTPILARCKFSVQSSFLIAKSGLEAPKNSLKRESLAHLLFRDG